MDLPDKTRVREALARSMRAALEAMARSAEEDREGATHAESRQEGSKDMRATEQSYVARGKAMRAEALAEELGRFERLPSAPLSDDDPIASGALVGLDVEGSERVVFVAPQAGGTKVVVDGVEITVVTPSSPVGRALIGKRVGDDFVLSIRGTEREHVVEAVA